MSDSLRRIGAMLLRYLYLHKRSLPRTLEVVFWPVMELLVWGFMTVYIRQIAGPVAGLFLFLINAVIFWDILYRSQQSVSLGIVEDIWTQNISNVLVSPLRIPEWLFSTFLYGFLKVLVITAVLTVLSLAFYRIDWIGPLGLHAVPLIANLLLFGFALGVFTSGLIVRFGHSAEALVWGIPYLVQPLSAIYYPVAALPDWLRPVALALPSTHVMEGMRRLSQTGAPAHGAMLTAFGLNLIYFALGAAFFAAMFSKAKDTGRLARLGMD